MTARDVRQNACMQRRCRIAVLLASMSLAALSCASRTNGRGDAGNRKEGPQVQLDAYAYTGSPVDGHVTHRFRIANIGTQPVTITGVEPMCGCTVANIAETVIEPDSATYMDVDLHVTPGRTSASVYLYTNDVDDRIVSVTIAADRLPDGITRLDFVPAGIRINAEPGGMVEGTCLLKLTTWNTVLTVQNVDELQFIADDETLTATRIYESAFDDIGFTAPADGGTATDSARSAGSASEAVELFHVRYKYQAPKTEGIARRLLLARVSKSEKTYEALLVIVVNVRRSHAEGD